MLLPRRVTRLLLFLTAALLSIVGVSQLWAQYDKARGVRAAAQLGHILPASNASHPILILQHMPNYQPLYKASRLSHEAYARAWGYAYGADTSMYVPGKRGFLNKEYAIRQALRRELEARSVQWIMYTDADTVISDPLVPLHLLLPPSPAFDGANVLAAQDHHGLNAGVLLFRVTPLSLRLVNDIISSTEGDAAKHSEQHHLGALLRSQKSYGAAFAELPKAWLNAYWFDETGPGSSGGEETVDETSWRPQVQVHFVNHLKFKYSFRPALEGAVFAALSAREGGGVDKMPQVEWTRRHAQTWWANVEPGIERMRFLDERLDAVVDYRGEVIE